MILKSFFISWFHIYPFESHNLFGLWIIAFSLNLVWLIPLGSVRFFLATLPQNRGVAALAALCSISPRPGRWRRATPHKSWDSQWFEAIGGAGAWQKSLWKSVEAGHPLVPSWSVSAASSFDKPCRWVPFGRVSGSSSAETPHAPPTPESMNVTRPCRRPSHRLNPASLSHWDPFGRDSGLVALGWRWRLSLVAGHFAAWQ